MFGDIMAAELPSGAAAFLAACGLKGAVILAAALLVCAAMKRRSAAARHVVLAMSMAGVLMLPFVSAVAPALPVAALPEITPAAPLENAEATTNDALPHSLPAISSSEAGALPPAPVEPQTPVRPAELDAVPSPINWAAALTLLWAGGMLLSVAPIGSGLLSTIRRARKAETIEDPNWLKILGDAREHLGVRRRVRLLRCGEGEIPVTWGVFRPVVALSPEADAWPEDGKRVVLLHELAHVKRFDYLVQLAAYVVRAQHWFNPLAWLAVRALRMESERACDDLILGTGSRASDYARHLIDMVRTLRPASAGSVAIAVARRTWLERRIRAILDGRTRRGEMSRRALASATVCAVAACGILAALQPASSVLADSEDGIARTTLACGAKIALVSVRRHNADDKSFWRPDGTPMDETPYDHPIPPKTEEGRGLYEVALSFTDLPEGVRLFDAWVPEGRGGIHAVTQFEDWNGSGRLHVETVSVPRGTKTITVGVRVPDGRWKVPFGGGGYFSVEGGSVSDEENSLSALDCHESEGQVRITVMTTGTASEGNPRLVAIGRSGVPHYSGPGTSVGNGDGARMSIFAFHDVAKRDIREFRLETCGDESGEFRNVSLVQGKRTEVAVTPQPAPAARPAPKHGARYQRLIGAAFKMYANESKGGLWPPKTPVRGAFYPELDNAFINFLGQGGTPDELVAYLKGKAGVEVCYLGYGVKDDVAVCAVLEHLRRGGRTEHLRIEEGAGFRGLPTQGPNIGRLHAGVERFLITDINDPAAGVKTRSTLPVLWELPYARRDGAIGGHVLYMDGHTEWKPYPGEFPMTEKTVSAIRDAMHGDDDTQPEEPEAKTAAPDLPLRLIRIMKFRDDSYRAQIAAESDLRPRWYRENEAFLDYRVVRVDPEEETVAVYSDKHKETFVLRLEMVYDAAGQRGDPDDPGWRMRIVERED